MEEDFRKLLECNRSKFRAAVAVERLLCPLTVSHVISAEELQTLQNESPAKRLDKLLDIVKRRDYGSFKKFCVVLETTYPYMLNCMFLGVEPPASATARIEKANQNKVVEKEFEGNHSRMSQCVNRRNNIARSTSMTGHDLWKDRYSLLKNELKAVKRDLEQAKSELQRVEKERDSACHQLAELSGKQTVENIELQNNTCTSNSNSITNEKNNDYERLKREYVNVLTELQILRQQKADFSEKHNAALQEADYFRKQHKTVLNKCDLLVREAQGLNRKLEESSRECEKIKQDYEEIVLLREREKFEMKDGNIDLMLDRHQNPEDTFATEKYECLQKDYDQLQETHRELRSEYNHVFNRLQSIENDYSSMKDQFDHLISERDSLVKDSSGLKQQCEAALKNVEKAIRDRDNAVKSTQQAQAEKDAALKDLDKAMSQKVKIARELNKVTEERNAVVNEYRLVMSERDNVHRETEKVQDHFHLLQTANKYLTEEKEKLNNLNSALQDEINHYLAENDKLLGEIYSLKDKNQSLMLEIKNIVLEREKAIDDCDMLKHERDAARKERSEAIIHRDKILKECFKVKQKQELITKGEGKEMDSLRKQFQILSKELTNALHEADIAKQRCDWALLERDKAIHEHERLQNSHEHLQDEHSRVRNEMMDMLHDSDHIRTQHSEIMMELIDLKNRIESHLTSKGSERELLSSRDSAIDTDSMEWETESIVLEKVSRDKDLGIIIGGGRDTPLMPNDSSIVVTDVTKGSIAEGKLKVNDCLLKVNDLDLTNVEHKTAVQAITESSVINLTVRRRRSSSVKSLVHPVRLTLTEGNEHGIHVDEAKFIRYISPGSVASNHPMLSVGDKILTINGVSVENLSQDETDKLLSTSTVSLAVQKAKSTTPTHALHSLLEEVNNKINYENDMYQNLQSHRKKMLLMDSCNEVYEQGHRRGICYSGRSSPTTEGTSFQDSVSEPALNASPSLTPLYDGGKEKSQGTQTDSSEASVDANNDTHLASHDAHSSSPQVSPETSRSFMTDPSDHPFQYRNTSNEKPLPPPRSFSYMTTLMSSSTMPMSINDHDSKHYGTERSLPSPSMITSTAGHYTPTSMADEYPLDQTRTNASHRSRGTRPQSAPSSRNQYLPYTSHLDPLALAAPKLSPPAPPASAAVLKSRTVPFYTATSYVIPRYNAAPAKTQQCMPLSSRRDVTTPSNSGSVSKSHGGLSLDQCLPIQHARQGSSHSVDENDFRRKHGSQQSFDSSSGQHSNKLMNRMSLPGVYFSSQPCFPSGVSGSSVGSAGSLSSGQGTPLRTPTTPIVPVMEGEILAFDFSGHAPSSSADVNRNPEPRLVHIEKKDTLGISIAPGNNGGIFVCSVSAGSVAEKAGLKYGDQLLEYNGVNLRCANYEQAAKILKESGNSVTILAQFNPQRALEGDFDIGTCNSSISESSTACSTPVNRRKVKRDDSTITPPLPKDEKVVPQSDIEIPGDVRYVYLNHTSTNLGFNIAGGNATGIFVSEVDANSDVAKELSVGDQILEYDGCDMLSCTAEQALLELCKPTPGAVQALVQYNPAKFSAIKDQPGDSFYVRCLYDHTPNSKEELGFKKGDILYITDTMYQGYIGCWKACLVSPEDAQKRENGIVPSRMKAEQEILLHRSLALAHGDDHKLSGRRSLFRRSKKSSHSLAISHSREGSDSAASISTLSSDLGVVSYQTVEKLDSHIPRVVILFGPLAEVLCEKLADDFPYKFVYCKSEFVSLSDEKIDKSIAEGTFIDYSWKGGQLACTTLTSIKKVTDKHPLVVVSPQAIERLNTLQVYPIVLYIRFKSYKQIKEMRDSKYIPEKITSKDAKEMFENAQRLEKDYKHLFNGIVHGHSIGSICTAIQEAAAEQQKKTIWVPLSSV